MQHTAEPDRGEDRHADVVAERGEVVQEGLPEQFATFLRDDGAQWLGLIKMTGASAE